VSHLIKRNHTMNVNKGFYFTLNSPIYDISLVIIDKTETTGITMSKTFRIDFWLIRSWNTYIFLSLSQNTLMWLCRTPILVFCSCEHGWKGVLWVESLVMLYLADVSLIHLFSVCIMLQGLLWATDASCLYLMFASPH